MSLKLVYINTFPFVRRVSTNKFLCLVYNCGVKKDVYKNNVLV